MRLLMSSGPWPVPRLCSSNFPEFSGKQQSLKAFLSAVKVSASSSVSVQSSGQQQTTSRVEIQRVEVATSVSSTVRPIVTDGDGSQEGQQHEQKGRKQVKLWSFFAGPDGAPVQKREQAFQSAREVAERASKPKENPSPEHGSSATGTSASATEESASQSQPGRAPLAQLPAQAPTQPPAAQQAWKSLLGGPEKPPLCTGRKLGQGRDFLRAWLAL